MQTYKLTVVFRAATQQDAVEMVEKALNHFPDGGFDHQLHTDESENEESLVWKEVEA